MGILMSGEIYLKIRPDWSSLGDTIRRMRIKNEDYDDMEYEEDFALHDEEYFEHLMEMQKMMEEKFPDWYGCDKFWVSIIHEEGILMVQHDYLKAQAKKLYRDEEHLSQRFISLREFLRDAEYVGKYFRRTEPIDDCNKEDTTYMSKDPDNLALFKTKDAMIISTTFAGEQQFKIVDRRYLADGKYEFFGNYNDEYNDKADMYQAVFEQLRRNRKKNR